MDSTLAVVDAPQDIEALYRADADRLWRAVYAFAGDAEIASDAVAEAYAQLLRRGSAVRDPAAWVWRSAFQIGRGALKARRLHAAGSITRKLIGLAVALRSTGASVPSTAQ